MNRTHVACKGEFNLGEYTMIRTNVLKLGAIALTMAATDLSKANPQEPVKNLTGELRIAWA